MLSLAGNTHYRATRVNMKFLAVIGLFAVAAAVAAAFPAAEEEDGEAEQSRYDNNWDGVLNKNCPHGHGVIRIQVQDIFLTLKKWPSRKKICVLESSELPFEQERG